MGDDDDLDIFQLIAAESVTAVQLEIINHNSDAGNRAENTDLDMYIVNTDIETISSGAGLERIEFAEIPAGEGDIYYLIIDHYRGDNSNPSAYIINQEPRAASSSQNQAKYQNSMLRLISVNY